MMMYSSRTGKLFPAAGVNARCQKAYDKNGRPKPHGPYKPSVKVDPTYNKNGPPTKEQLKQVKTLAKAIQDDYILDSILKENNT